MADDSKSKSQDYRTQIIVAVIGLLSAVSVAVVTNWDKLFPSQPSQSTVASTQNSTKVLDKSGLYIASTILSYPNGDQLKADFRVYCPAYTIRPTNYVLVDNKGTVKKQGRWWEAAFIPRYDSERQLVKKVCDK